MTAPRVSALIDAATGPLVSVIIPAHNAAAFIHSTLDSVAWQTHRPIEIVVVDDSAAPDTGAVVAQWASAHSGSDTGLELKLVRAEPGSGPKNRNIGLQSASGQFIQFLDHDDLLHRHKLAQQVEVGLLTGADLIVARNRGFVQRSEIEALLAGDGLLSQPLHVPDPYFAHFRWSHLSWLVRRELLDRTGPWNEQVAMSDYEMDTRLKLHARHVAYVDRLFSYYRKQTPGSNLRDNVLRLQHWRYQVTAAVYRQLRGHRIDNYREYSYLARNCARTGLSALRKRDIGLCLNAALLWLRLTAVASWYWLKSRRRA